jgi:adenylate cyclase
MGQYSPLAKPSAPAEEAGLRADQVREQLGRIVASVTFRGSLRLTSFLRFVVETALAGHGNRIKAYTVAVEALGRPENFDPQDDPIVRVEAVRLRQALAHYYADVGVDDSVIIEMPRGSYVPVFGRRRMPTNMDMTGVACPHRAPSTVQMTLERLAKLRRHLALLEAEIQSAARLLERSGGAL